MCFYVHFNDTSLDCYYISSVLKDPGSSHALARVHGVTWTKWVKCIFKQSWLQSSLGRGLRSPSQFTSHFSLQAIFLTPVTSTEIIVSFWSLMKRLYSLLLHLITLFGALFHAINMHQCLFPPSLTNTPLTNISPLCAAFVIEYAEYNVEHKM